MRRILCVLAILPLYAAARASDPQPPPSPGATTAATPTATAPKGLDLVHQLERLAAGKPLPLAAAAEPEALRQLKPMPDVAGKPLLEALGLIGDAFSSPLPKDLPDIFLPDAERRRIVFQPYAFQSSARNIWTIARDRRMADPTPTEAADTLSNMPDYQLSRMFFHSLDAAQLERATKAGLRWTDLSGAQKRVLKLILGRPYAVYKTEPAAGDDTNRTYIAASGTPLDIERCTLHVYIGFETLWAPTGKTPSTSPGVSGDPPMPETTPEPPGPELDSYNLHPNDLLMRLVGREMPWRPRPIAIYDPKMKPSDLAFNASALSAPIGLNGVMPLEKVIAAAASASKMPLVVDRRLGCLDAFVGDARMDCRDVLRLLAYSFDGAWRKVGSRYLLTWDRKGKVAEALEEQEHSGWTVRRWLGWAAAEKEMATPDWEALAEKTLGPPPDLPLAPTPEQWKAYTGDDSADSPQSPDEDFPEPKNVFAFERLDAAQRELLREAFASRRTLPDSDPANAPFPVEILEKSHLGNPSLLVYVDIPAIGTVNVSRATFAMLVLNPIVQSVNKHVAKELRDADTKRAEALKAPPKLKYATKAVAAAPLSAGQWARLLAQMNRKGLDTVYVPVFWNGQTLFPSKQFPLMPLCRGEDLLAKVLALAKARKIHVVAVVNALAWRLPASEAHYLSRRPDLVDVDATGRSRRAWGLQHPLTTASFIESSSDIQTRMYDPLMVSDFVRPTAPEVRSRLLGLVRELRRYKGLDGVALARWTRIAGPSHAQTIEAFSDDVLPRLGYTLAERAAFLSERGVDPLDVVRGSDEEGCDQADYQTAWTKRGYSQDFDLAKALLNELETGWPGRTQVLSPFDPSSELKPPDARVFISTTAKAPRGSVAYLQVAPPVVAPPEITMESGEMQMKSQVLKPDEVRIKRLDHFHAMLCGFDPLRMSDSPGDHEEGLPAPKGIVLDFTGSPDLLWDGLAMLPNR